MVINYMTSHDNHTLWDKLAMSAPEADEAAKTAMVRLGASVVMISRGTPFFLAGEEMLRSKGGDSNSYKSSDEVNNLRWDDLVPGSGAAAMRDFYRALISLRRSNAFITAGDLECEVRDDCAIELRWTLQGKTAAWALINPGQSMEVELPAGEWQVLLRNETVDPDGADTVSGTVTAEERTVLLVRNPEL